MNIKRIMAAALSVLVIGGTMPVVRLTTPMMTTYAEEATEVTEGALTFNVYADHAEVIKCAYSAEGDIVIPGEISNVPVTSIRPQAFMYCDKLISVSIPDTVTSLGNGAFEYCWALETVDLPDSLTSIDNYAFQGCQKLKSITIPAAVSNIGSRVFELCYSLTAINVDSENQYYVSEDGVLFNKDKTNLIAYPAMSSITDYTVPDSVTNIAESAFWGAKNLISISLPDSLTIIYGDTFYECYGLKNMVVPLSVVNIGDRAFCYCAGLETLTILNKDCSIYDSSWTIISDESPEEFYYNMTIRGYEGSTAQEYAEKYGIKFEIADDSERGYSEVVEGALTYYVYPDHAELIGCDTSAEGEIVIADKVNGVPVILIKDNAFDDTESVTSVTIPETVTNIGMSAFFSCGKLAEFIVDENNAVYSSADGVLYSKDRSELILYPENKSDEKFSIPYGVRKIGRRSFSSNNNLSELTMPVTVDKIEGYAFVSCKNLRFFNIINPECELEEFCINKGMLLGYADSTAQAYAEENGLEFLTLNDRPREIKEAPLTIIAYLDHAEVKQCDTSADGEITIPEMANNVPVTKIQYMAFDNCTGITKVNIPDTVTEIGERAFGDCTALVSADIPDSVTELGEYAFCGCSALEDVTIPDSITELKTMVFSRCDSLKTITIPSSVTSLGSGVFAMSGIERIVIPDTVTSMGTSMFMDCTALTSVKLPDSIDSIAKGTFNHCTSLEEITIPKSVKNIGENAFGECTALKSVILPASVSAIEKNAFAGLPELEYITIMNPDCEIYDSVYTMGGFNCVIRGYSGSTAEKYAVDYSLKFEVLTEPVVTYGDVNGDNTVNLNDAVAILQYVALSAKYPLDAQAQEAADVCDNGTSGINGNDALAVMMVDAGIISPDELPVTSQDLK